MSSSPRIGFVGGGWRASIYFRTMAALGPAWRPVSCLLRTESTAREVNANWGIPTTTSWSEFVESGRPDFVVVCVSPSAAAPLVIQLAEAGVPVLCETPLALDLAGLNDLAGRLGEARVQVAEQYRYQPHHAARLAIAGSNVLGTIESVHLSIAHDYHAMSLFRALLGVGFDDVTVRAVTLDDRAERADIDGPVPGNRIPEQAARLVAQLVVTRNGKNAVYDFSDLQYFSPIRPRRLIARGTRGELETDTATFLGVTGSPARLDLVRHQTGHDGDLFGAHLHSITFGDFEAYRNPFAPIRLSDDEIAIATVLRNMAAYSEGGPAFYGMGDAMQDQYLALLMHEAAATGEAVGSTPQRWVPAGGSAPPTETEQSMIATEGPRASSYGAGVMEAG